MSKFTHTLEGYEAVAARMLVEVKELFHNRSMRKRTEDFRMEFYIMAAMTSEAMAMYCCRKSQIVKLVNAMFSDYAEGEHMQKEVNTAFRRLACRGFIRGRMESYGFPVTRRERHYELNLEKYDTSWRKA